MGVKYSGHLLTTRQQACWQSLVILLALAPLVAWRFNTEPLPIALTLAGLVIAPFAIAYQAWKFLREQERDHPQPTPEMLFVFRFLTNTPPAMGALLLILLVEIG